MGVCPTDDRIGGRRSRRRISVRHFSEHRFCRCRAQYGASPVRHVGLESGDIEQRFEGGRRSLGIPEPPVRFHSVGQLGGGGKPRIGAIQVI
jgi:hypothetical protein